ncbi:histidine phosphatase family protein [Bacillus spongiae]|uniref:Histidine phosphatase family protein n=1 Tax=Bacillus spongiae TaxID=2683610 RepID=A0ABU8HCF6_9BACI
MTTTVYMVRHAKSPFIFGEEKTRKLSEEGVYDAKRVMELLREKDIDMIVSSPYTRAVQTVQQLAEKKGLPIFEYEVFKERAIKGLDYKLPEQDILNAIKLSFEDKLYCLQGGESTFEAQSRAIPTFKQLLQQNKNIVMGTHGNIMTIIMNYFDERYGYDFWKSTSKPDIYELTFERNHLKDVQRIWAY